MKQLLEAFRSPTLLILLVFGLLGTSYGIWSVTTATPEWIDQSGAQLHDSQEYPNYMTAKGEATSAHKRMAIDKARLKAISNLMRSAEVTANGVQVITQKTSSGKRIQKKFNGNMSDFEELDFFVEKEANGEYRAHMLIGLKKQQ